MSPSDWQVRRQGWTSQETAGAYEESRFASFLGRRKHANDLARVLAVLTRHLSVPAADSRPTLLDLPCGTGRLRSALKAAGYNPLGADLSPEMLRAGGAPLGSAALLLAEAERLPLAPAAVEAVISLRFLFHIRDADARRRILREMSRVTRQLVIGQVRDPSSLKHRLRRTRRALGLSHKLREPAMTLEQLRAELAAANLELMELVPLSRLFSDKSLFVARPLAAEGNA